MTTRQWRSCVIAVSFSLSTDQTMKRTNHLFILLFAILISSACSDSDSPEVTAPPDLYELGSFTDGDYTVLAYSKRPLDMGYHPVWVEVHKSGEPVDQLHVQLTPLMEMHGHSHSSPVEEPSVERDAEHGLFAGAVVFTMASGEMGSWQLQLRMDDPEHSDLGIEGVIDLDVDESDRVNTFETDDEERFVLTLVEPEEPETGMNDLRVTLHRRASAMEFLAVQDAVIGFEPWMPGMGHGSSNNEDPVHDSTGHYHGLVNFNMTGDWELRFDLEIDGEEIEQQIFDVSF
jgi:hypothetical protein